HHLDRAAGEPEGEREDRVRAPPVEDLVEIGGHHRLLDVLFQLLGGDVPAQHVARAQLAGPHLYFQSRAPRRQTKTSATASSTTKSTISPSTKRLSAAFTIVPTG